MPASLEDSLRAALDALRAAGLERLLPRLDGAQGPEMLLEGRRILVFASNNYLGLAGDGRVGEALAEAARTGGVGAGASRLVSGTMAAHRHLEDDLARFLDTERALVFATGYAANVGTLSALLGKDDVVFSDALNHASLIDGCRLAGARIVVYPHSDTAALEALLRERRRGGRRALIVTDAVFSMDGDRAPLAALRRLADAHDAALMVDEAHAFGVLGPGGRGLSAELGVRPDVLVGTFGKALGTAGAFVAGGDPLIRWLEHRARSFVFSTAPPPALMEATRAALTLATAADDRRRTLLAHAARIRAGLRDLGAQVPDGDTPIVPLLVGDPRRATDLSRALLERGVFVQAIRPPTVPDGTSRLRIVPMATHTEAHVDRLLAALAEALR